ncbi:MAG: LLM class flavin-dependent oxidoreductase [Acidobacteria bacterium]|nr:LLM class flavin-dependent oxidoreductase [Acidobacteriota bacterium]
MIFDVFFSICQTDVDGVMPDEHTMFTHFFDQVKWADELGFGTAWVAETHLSCQIQKRNPGAVIPHFRGEIGLNTDILQMAHLIFQMTKHIAVGSAIRNIQCNGGPIAHAEAIRTFLSLRAAAGVGDRILELGFAAGRFPFSNIPYGIHPRNDWEQAAWPALRGKVFKSCVEIFLRFLRGEVFSSDQVTPITLTRPDFRSDGDWESVCSAYGNAVDMIPVDPFWRFPDVGVIPFETPMDALRLTIGAHDAPTQILANQFLPVGVFNLSFTPTEQIESTHELMKLHYHRDGGPWKRDYMPRTALVFLDDSAGLSTSGKNERARERAKHAMENYWRALQGTIDPQRIREGVDNALVGSPEAVIEQMHARFHQGDRLMLWFDFHNHDNEDVKNSMRLFMEKVAPSFS